MIKGFRYVKHKKFWKDHLFGFITDDTCLHDVYFLFDTIFHIRMIVFRHLIKSLSHGQDENARILNYK